MTRKILTTLFIIFASAAIPGCFDFNTSNIPCKSNADCKHEMTCVDGFCIAIYLQDGGYVGNVEVSDIEPATPYVTVNKTKQFSATVTGASDTSVNWSASAGVIDSNGLFTAPPAPQEVIVIAKSNAKQSVFKQTTVKVVAAPSITSFTANPAAIPYDDISKLTGVFVNGTGMINNGIGGVTSGVAVDTPKLKSPVTYKLTVTNLAGESAENSADVTVQAVTITDISPATPYVTVDKTKEFSAAITGAADATVDWTSTCGTIDTTGLFSAPATTQSCEITATSHGKPDVFKKTGVTVVAEPHITSFVAAKSPISSGKSTTLTAVFEEGAGEINQGVGSVTSYTPVTISPTSDTTYTIIVTNLAGDTTTADTSVAVVPAPSITSFTASPDKVTVGDDQKSNLTAVFSGGTGEVDNGIGAVTSNVAKQTNALNATTTFKLTVTNTLGDTVTSQATVTAYDAPAIQSFTASPDNPVPYDGTVTFSATFTGGTGSIDQGVGEISSGGTKTKPNMTADATFTLAVTNLASKIATQAVDVYVQPRNVTGLAATPADSGAKLTWTDPADADLDHIEINWTPVGGSKTVNKGANTANINSLTNDTAYTFTVKAVDTAGYKSAGAAIGAIPAALQDVSGLAPEATDKQVWLAWTEPAASTVYKGVHLYCTQGGTPCGDMKISKGTTTTSFTGLTNDLSYLFTAKSYDILDTEKSPGVSVSATPLGCEGKPDFTPCHIKGALYKYNICVDQVCVMPGCGNATCNTPGPNFLIPPETGSHFTRDTLITGEPVVHDTVTGLEWQGCAAGLSGDDCGTGSALTKTWTDALGYCNTLDWRGHTDWRLPSTDESQTVIDYGKFSPSIDTSAFPATPSNDFWSSASDANNGSYAWSVVCDNGHMDVNAKTSLYNVRCVRGSGYTAPQRFSRTMPVANQPIVYDNMSKLTWQGCAAGYFGENCQTGNAEVKTWTNAIAYCTDLNWGGYSTGWRLPNVMEIVSIINWRNIPSIDTTAFPATPENYFWSSSSYAPGTTYAWRVNFHYGYVYSYSKTTTNSVRCVRDEP